MQYKEAGQASLPISDRAAAYGDGFFTTVQIRNQQPLLWPLHLQRLQKAAKTLRIHVEHWSAIANELHAYSQDCNRGVAKLWVSRGSGGRGYAPDEAGPTRHRISLHAFPEHYEKWRVDGVHLGISTVQLAQQPRLAGIKHLNRLEQVLVKQDLFDQNALRDPSSPFDDVVTMDTQGNVIEASSANLMWIKGGHWFTPSTTQAGIDGVYKQYFAQRLANRGSAVATGEYALQELLSADAVLMCNSLMECVPVSAITSDGIARNFPIAPIHQWVQELTL